VPQGKRLLEPPSLFLSPSPSLFQVMRRLCPLCPIRTAYNACGEYTSTRDCHPLVSTSTSAVDSTVSACGRWRSLVMGACVNPICGPAALAHVCGASGSELSPLRFYLPPPQPLQQTQARWRTLNLAAQPWVPPAPAKRVQTRTKANSLTKQTHSPSPPHT